MNEQTYDRTTQDVGNIVALEHVNVTVPDQATALQFYISGLGLTRDPYMMVGVENMWVNVGQQQFHLPTRAPQVLRGHTGLVLPDLEALQRRLKRVQDRLSGTAFTWSVEDGYVAVTCPWGNHIRCHVPGPQFGDMTLGMPYVELFVQPGTAPGIARFYRDVMHAPATVSPAEPGAVTTVRVGQNQALIFRETNADIPPYDGHHIAIYVANFSGPHAFLKNHNLITEESDTHQYRFQDIVDPETGHLLCQIEHEVRSLYHPMWGRPLVNRNAAQNIRAYTRGRDAFV
jgi:catechol 2,3-dioxygenase-like lactoylglutathione lyase family enzyme